jgi:hypothetical protein
VVTTAVYAQALADSSRLESAGEILYPLRLPLAWEWTDVHGKEKVYGSIP